MAKKAKKEAAPEIAAPESVDQPQAPVVDVAALLARIEELEGDLVRIVDLLVKGDLEAAKFRDILAKRQGK